MVRPSFGGYRLKPSTVKAVALYSGGLDSMLAVRTILEQGIEVIPVCFDIGVCFPGKRGKERGEPGGRNLGDKFVSGTEPVLRVESIDIYDSFWPVLIDPKHGYGSAMNPCIDCKIHMLRSAKSLMEERGARFLITGEVVGQRPMSQRRDTMRLIEKESGAEGYLLRPLSAKLLPPTIPEKEGWVDRERLYDFSGRNRKAQIDLAATLGMKDYPMPAGGCCLTDHVFAERLRDFLGTREEETVPDRTEIHLLIVGRHFRLPRDGRAIVARDQGECRILESTAVGGWRMEAAGVVGPLTLLPGDPCAEDLETAAAITAGYGRGGDRDLVTIHIRRMDEERHLDVVPIGRDRAKTMWIG